jgi:hypothetical protein
MVAHAKRLKDNQHDLQIRNVFRRIDAGVKQLVSVVEATDDKNVITPELRIVFDHLSDIVKRLDLYNPVPLKGQRQQLTPAQAFYFEPVEGVSDDDLADAVVDRRDPRHAGMGEVAIKALGNETSIAFKCIQALDKAKDLNKEDIYIKVGNSLRPIPRSGAYVKKQALACKDYGEVWKAKGKRSGNKKNK